MSEISGKLSELRKFLTALTWKKIAQCFVFLLIIILSWSYYENRQTVYNMINQAGVMNSSQTIQSISSETKSRIDFFVNKSDLILGIKVTQVDFQKNIRHILYLSVDHPIVKELFGKFLDSSVSALPLFNNDTIHNRRMVGLINGDFICNPYIESTGAKIIPETTKYIHTVCSVGIPPYYGRFTGIVSVYLTRQPTIDELDQIRNMARALSSEIYDKELK